MPNTHWIGVKCNFVKSLRAMFWQCSLLSVTCFVLFWYKYCTLRCSAHTQFWKVVFASTFYIKRNFSLIWKISKIQQAYQESGGWWITYFIKCKIKWTIIAFYHINLQPISHDILFTRKEENISKKKEKKKEKEKKRKEKAL